MPAPVAAEVVEKTEEEKMAAEIKIRQNVILKALTEKHAHLLDYLVTNFDDELGVPMYIEKLDRKHKKLHNPNVIYPAGGPVFIHIYPGKKGRNIYSPIEPSLNERTTIYQDKIITKLTELIKPGDIPKTKEQHIELYDQYIKRIVSFDDEEIGEDTLNIVQKVLKKLKAGEKIYVDPVTLENVRYYFIRNKIGLGKLEPLILDSYIEDITCNGVGPLFVEHKIFESLESNIKYHTFEELDEFALYLSERSGRPATHSAPVVDASLPDGSRINIVYGEDISRAGSNFTIRKFSDDPISVVNLINWKTMSSLLAAFLWMVLESHHSMMVVGETASGKTTSLNGLLTFIHPNSKIVSIEDTPEVKVPHTNWTTEVTRPASAGAAVDIFLLVKAALRQRPNLIIVGEIRGEEGAMAFQAMQTGHPLIATFHAGSVKAFVNRMTGHPISIPPAFIALLDVIMIQMAVHDKNGKLLRRVMSINELVDYLPKKDKFRYVELFAWDAGTDSHIFRNQSFIFEAKIAKKRGIKRSNIKVLYDELRLRRHILEAMLELKIFDYYMIFGILTKFCNTNKLPPDLVTVMKRRMKEEDDEDI
ncbi:MAG: type II/IV secretion system ATPase subunit [archaeon]|nr:type II/IV secretion system ATPase subunit [archaeon]